MVEFAGRSCQCERASLGLPCCADEGEMATATTLGISGRLCCVSQRGLAGPSLAGAQSSRSGRISTSPIYGNLSAMPSEVVASTLTGKSLGNVGLVRSLPISNEEVLGFGLRSPPAAAAPRLATAPEAHPENERGSLSQASSSHDGRRTSFPYVSAKAASSLLLLLAAIAAAIAVGYAWGQASQDAVAEARLRALEAELHRARRLLQVKQVATEVTAKVGMQAARMTINGFLAGILAAFVIRPLRKFAWGRFQRTRSS